MIQKIPRYLLTFYSTSGAMAVERYCKERDRRKTDPGPEGDLGKLWAFLGSAT
jgi:hypothetical protein